MALMTSSGKAPSGFLGRKKKLLTRIGLGVGVIALLGGTGFVLFMKIKFADFQPPMSAANVIVTPVTAITFVDRIEAVGTLAANQSATITATVTETVDAINVQEGEFVTKGTPIIDLKSSEERATLVEASRSYQRYNNLAKSNLGSAEKRDEEEATMVIAKAQLDKRKITAPFDGVLGIRHVDVGDLVMPGTVITTIDEIDPIKLDFTLPEVYLADLKKDMAVSATTVAYPGQIFEGKIYVVDSRVDPQTRAVAVRATIPNPDRTLKPGLLMHVNIIRSARTALAIPEEAVMSAGDKKAVFVVGADTKIVKKEIVTGLREPGLVEVVSGLQDGDKVVSEGQMKTGEGAPVVVTETRVIADTQKEALRFSNARKQEDVAAEAVAQVSKGGAASPSQDTVAPSAGAAPEAAPASEDTTTPAAGDSQ